MYCSNMNNKIVYSLYAALLFTCKFNSLQHSFDELREFQSCIYVDHLMGITDRLYPIISVGNNIGKKTNYLINFRHASSRASIKNHSLVSRHATVVEITISVILKISKKDFCLSQ